MGDFFCYASVILINSIAISKVSILHFGAVFGSVFGGLVGDIACQKNPTVGRILCAQFSAGVTIPLCALLLEGFSKPAIHSLLFGLMFFFMGFCSFWVPSACSFPILSEVIKIVNDYYLSLLFTYGSTSLCSGSGCTI